MPRARALEKLTGGVCARTTIHPVRGVTEPVGRTGYRTAPARIGESRADDQHAIVGDAGADMIEQRVPSARGQVLKRIEQSDAAAMDGSRAIEVGNGEFHLLQAGRGTLRECDLGRIVVDAVIALCQAARAQIMREQADAASKIEQWRMRVGECRADRRVEWIGPQL